MKLENNKRDFIREGDEQTTKMSISADVESHIIKVLTEHSYDDPLGSSIRECVSNAVDSVMEAGTNEPVIVSIVKNKAGNNELVIEDKGLGLDDASFKKYIMGLGESTKRNNDKLLGGYGAGAKAWLAYTDSFTYTCFKDGVERKYLIFKGEEFPECSQIHEKPTSRVNGVIVSVQLKSSWMEVHTCETKIKEQLAYLDNVYYNIPGFKNTYKIYKTPCFMFSDLSSNNEMHISLKNIRYSIDWSKLKMNRINLPLALRFDTYDDIKPIFNRESIQYTSATIKAIKAKMLEVAMWFKQKWDDEVSEFDSFRDARESITTNDREVKVGDQMFDVKDLFKEFNIQVKPPRVKGVKLKSPKYYADLDDKLLGKWECTAIDHNKTWRKSHLKYDFQRQFLNNNSSGYKFILVNESVSGYYKDYLREKHPATGSNRVFYVEEARRFRMADGVTPIDLTYDHLCGLTANMPHPHQDYIDELELVVSHYEKAFIDERGTKSSKVFQDWVDARRAQIRAGAKPKTPGTYVSLDKQEDEITVYTARPAKVGNAIVYEKGKEKIEDIRKIKGTNSTGTYTKKPTVYVEVGEEVIHDRIVETFMESFNFVKLNPTEIKHVKHLNYFISKQKFMEAKPLARLATAFLIKEILDLDPPNADIVNVTFGEMGKLRQKLVEYSKTELEGNRSTNSVLKKVILDDAKERNNWDRSIYADAMLYKEKMKPFRFLSLLKNTDKWYNNEEESAALKNILYIMLKHYKVTHKTVDEFELLPKVQPMAPEDINDLQIAVA